MKRHRHLASFLALGIGVTSAVAQQGGAPTKPEEPAAEPEEAPLKLSFYGAGYMDWALRGNENKFRQYATPPRGFFIGPAEGKFVGKDGTYGQFWYAGVPGTDHIGYSRVIALNGKSSIEFGFRRNLFNDPNPAATDNSTDKSNEITFTQNLKPNVGFFFSSRKQERDSTFAPPKDTTQSRLRTTTAGIEGRTLGGQVGVTYSDVRFVDRTGSQPDSVQRRWMGHYGVELGNMLSLEGVAGSATIEQTGMRNSHVKTLGLNGGLLLGPDTDVSFSFLRERFDLPNVADAYVQERATSAVQLSHKWSKWNFQFGYRHRETERVRADHTYVDVPKTDAFDVRLTGRLADNVRATARYTYDHLSKPATMTTDDPRQLFWSNRVRVQGRLQAYRGPYVGYVNYGFNYLQNQKRNAELRSQTWTVGASAQLSSTVDGFFEVVNDRTKASGVYDPTGFDLSSFFPSSTSTTVGLNIAMKHDAWFSANYTYFVTNNDNPVGERGGNIKGQYITLQLRKKYSDDHEFSLLVAPWQYRDRLFTNMGFDTTTVMVKYTKRF